MVINRSLEKVGIKATRSVYWSLAVDKLGPNTESPAVVVVTQQIIASDCVALRHAKRQYEDEYECVHT